MLRNVHTAPKANRRSHLGRTSRPRDQQLRSDTTIDMNGSPTRRPLSARRSKNNLLKRNSPYLRPNDTPSSFDPAYTSPPKRNNQSEPYHTPGRTLPRFEYSKHNSVLVDSELQPAHVCVWGVPGCYNPFSPPPRTPPKTHSDDWKTRSTSRHPPSPIMLTPPTGDSNDGLPSELGGGDETTTHDSQTDTLRPGLGVDEGYEAEDDEGNFKAKGRDEPKSEAWMRQQSWSGRPREEQRYWKIFTVINHETDVWPEGELEAAIRRQAALEREQWRRTGYWLEREPVCVVDSVIVWR